MEPSILLGYLAIGAALTLVGLVIIAITKPIQLHLPASPYVRFDAPDGDIFEHGLALRSDRRVLSAALTSLAVRRHVRILAPRGKRGPVAVQVLNESGLSPREREFLALLRPGAVSPRKRSRYLRALGQLGIAVPDASHTPDVFFLKGRAAFSRTQRRRLTRFIDRTRESMRAQGLVKRGSGSFHLVLLSLLFLVTSVIGLFLVIGAIASGEWIGAIVVLAGIAAVFWVLTLAPPPLLRFTGEGRALRTHLAGMRDYVRLAESERLRALQSADGALRTPAGALTPGGVALGLTPQPTANDPVAQSQLDRFVLIERLLPYAILFREEKTWQRELEHVGGAPELTQNLRVLGSTLEHIMAVLEILATIGQLLRAIGAVFSLFGRL